MKKPIFENEQEARKHYNDVYPHYRYCGHAVDHMVDTAKQKGYIKKSAVEKAEEMYKGWLKIYLDCGIKDHSMFTVTVVENLYRAIQELKAEIKRLNEYNN